MNYTISYKGIGHASYERIWLAIRLSWFSEGRCEEPEYKEEKERGGNLRLTRRITCEAELLHLNNFVGGTYSSSKENCECVHFGELEEGEWKERIELHGRVPRTVGEHRKTMSFAVILSLSPHSNFLSLSPFSPHSLSFFLSLFFPILSQALSILSLAFYFFLIPSFSPSLYLLLSLLDSFYTRFSLFINSISHIPYNFQYYVLVYSYWCF